MPKRALIVDDSRSARVILSRMLEGYGLTVDTSESAEQALEYLQQARPDVIFMDHLMPGMDGFQAVRAIKSNAETATIPVLMYTSQEGELYLSQARALGAVGVLPKTVKQSDVSRVLYSLRLLPDRRESQVGAAQVSAKAMPKAVNDSRTVHMEPQGAEFGQMESAIRAAVGPLFTEHTAELRRFLMATLETFSRRISSDAKPPEAQPVESEPAPPEPPAAPAWRPVYAALAVLALLPTFVLAYFYNQTLRDTQALLQSNGRLTAALQAQQADLAQLRETIEANAAASAAADPAASGGLVESMIVPYGEAPLSGARLEHLRRFIEQLKLAGFRGRIKVTSRVGEFCLAGNPLEGFSMAADDAPVRRCDLIGNPFEESLSAPQRQSLAFANLMSSIRQDTGDALRIEVEHAGKQPAAAYPPRDRVPGPTAGEWNRIAAQNNRVEFVAEPGA